MLHPSCTGTSTDKFCYSLSRMSWAMVSRAALMPYAPFEDDSIIDTRLLQHIKERLLISIMTGDGVAAAAGRRDAAAEAAVQDDHVPHRRSGWRHDGGLPPSRGALGAAPEVSTDSAVPEYAPRMMAAAADVGMCRGQKPGLVSGSQTCLRLWVWPVLQRTSGRASMPEFTACGHAVTVRWRR